MYPVFCRGYYWYLPLLPPSCVCLACASLSETKAYIHNDSVSLWLLSLSETQAPMSNDAFARRSFSDAAIGSMIPGRGDEQRSSPRHLSCRIRITSRAMWIDKGRLLDQLQAQVRFKPLHEMPLMYGHKLLQSRQCAVHLGAESYVQPGNNCRLYVH